jgi:hypothetical protein
MMTGREKMNEKFARRGGGGRGGGGYRDDRDMTMNTFELQRQMATMGGYGGYGDPYRDPYAPPPPRSVLM